MQLRGTCRQSRRARAGRARVGSHCWRCGWARPLRPCPARRVLDHAGFASPGGNPLRVSGESPGSKTLKESPTGQRHTVPPWFTAAVTRQGMSSIAGIYTLSMLSVRWNRPTVAAFRKGHLRQKTPQTALNGAAGPRRLPVPMRYRDGLGHAPALVHRRSVGASTDDFRRALRPRTRPSSASGLVAGALTSSPEGVVPHTPGAAVLGLPAAVANGTNRVGVLAQTSAVSGATIATAPLDWGFALWASVPAGTRRRPRRLACAAGAGFCVPRTPSFATLAMTLWSVWKS